MDDICLGSMYPGNIYTRKKFDYTNIIISYSKIKIKINVNKINTSSITWLVLLPREYPSHKNVNPFDLFYYIQKFKYHN